MRTRMASERSPSDPTPCPVPCGATRRPLAVAKRTTAWTSAELAGTTTSAGFCWNWTFQGVRASSQPSSPGARTDPRTA